MIRLNYSNMMYDVIGSNGISRDLLDDFKIKVVDIHNRIRNREFSEMAFVDLPEFDTTDIKNIAGRIRKDAEDFLLLGIGGSALGPKSIVEALSPMHNLKKKPRVFIYDNVDPTTLVSILRVIDLKKTFINVISKSGSTAETAVSFKILWDKMKKVHKKNVSERFIITTDPEKGDLREIAKKERLKSLPIPTNIGGRYSVLTAVGLLTAEVIGIDSNMMLKGAKDLQKRCFTSDLLKNPAYLFSILLYLMDKEKGRRLDVLVPYSDGLKCFSEWFSQLWAESLGKDNKGLTPYPSIGATDQHSQLQMWIDGLDDKVIVFIRIKDYSYDIEIPYVFDEYESFKYLSGKSLSDLIKAEQEATELALYKAKRPNMTIMVPEISPYYLGQLFQFFEIATVFAGLLYGINPFNQPGVEEGKRLTYGIMGRNGFKDKKKEMIEYRKIKKRWIV
jgi:glucose-6-phosphate isomerase